MITEEECYAYGSLDVNNQTIEWPTLPGGEKNRTVKFYMTQESYDTLWPKEDQ